MLDEHHDFLINVGTLEKRHSGRSLFAHLKGVHDLLRDWGNEPDVCHAGLFHSIYGTQTYKPITIGDRRIIREMIGDYAELLVHTFSTKDRPLFESITNERMRAQLIEIEAANLYEQGGSEKTLRKLRKMKLSNGAKAALGAI